MPKNAAAISRNSAKSALSGLLDLLRLGQSDGVAQLAKCPVLASALATRFKARQMANRAFLMAGGTPFRKTVFGIRFSNADSTR